MEESADAAKKPKVAGDDEEAEVEVSTGSGGGGDDKSRVSEE